MRYGLYLGYNAKPWQDIFTASATQQYDLGTFFDDEHGRRFRYAQNGAGALSAGHIVQGAPLGGAATTLQSACPVTAAVPVGGTRIYFNGVTTAQAEGLFNEGWVGIWDNDIASVYTRRIKYSSAITTSGGTSYIDLYDPLTVALDTNDRLALQVNPYRNTIVQPAGRIGTGLTLGGVHCAVPANYFYWVQTIGFFAFRIKDVTTNIGVGPIGPAGTTAGTLITAAEADTAAAYTPVVGWSTAQWLDEYAGIMYLKCE